MQISRHPTRVRHRFVSVVVVKTELLLVEKGRVFHFAVLVFAQRRTLLFLPLVSHGQCLHDAPFNTVLDCLCIVISFIFHSCPLLLFKTFKLILDAIQIFYGNFQSLCLIIVFLIDSNLLLSGQQFDLLCHFRSACFSLWCHRQNATLSYRLTNNGLKLLSIKCGNQWLLLFKV